MNWINLLWGIAGLAIGFGISQYLQRFQRKSRPKMPLSAVPLTPQQLQERVKQLELAYQMATESSQLKAGFLARVSHELRSPLNGLIGMHQLILSDLCENPEEEREFIAQANTSALKMVKVLDDVLSVAKAEHGTLKLTIQPIQLAQMLQDAYQMTHLAAKDRNLKLQLLPPDPDLYVAADPPRLRQVLVNLVNGLIAQTPEGSITLSATAVPEFGYARIWLDDQCPIEVRSEPIDLMQIAQAQVVPPDPVKITQAKQKHGGKPPVQPPLPSSGLNLLVGQTLLELMGGTLEVVPATPPSETITLTRIQCCLPLIPSEPTVGEG